MSTLRLNLMLLSAIIIMALPALIVSVVGWNTAASLAMLVAMGGLFSAPGLREQVGSFRLEFHVPGFGSRRDRPTPARERWRLGQCSSHDDGSLTRHQ
jgi:hypothetical protein